MLFDVLALGPRCSSGAENGRRRHCRRVPGWRGTTLVVHINCGARSEHMWTTDERNESWRAQPSRHPHLPIAFDRLGVDVNHRPGRERSAASWRFPSPTSPRSSRRSWAPVPRITHVTPRGPRPWPWRRLRRASRRACRRARAPPARHGRAQGARRSASARVRRPRTPLCVHPATPAYGERYDEGRAHGHGVADGSDDEAVVEGLRRAEGTELASALGRHFARGLVRDELDGSHQPCSPRLAHEGVAAGECEALLEGTADRVLGTGASEDVVPLVDVQRLERHRRCQRMALCMGWEMVHVRPQRAGIQGQEEDAALCRCIRGRRLRPWCGWRRRALPPLPA